MLIFREGTQAPIRLFDSFAVGPLHTPGGEALLRQRGRSRLMPFCHVPPQVSLPDSGSALGLILGPGRHRDGTEHFADRRKFVQG